MTTQQTEPVTQADCKFCNQGYFDCGGSYYFGQDIECVNGVLIDIDEAHEGWQPDVCYPLAPCHPNYETQEPNDSDERLAAWTANCTTPAPSQHSELAETIAEMVVRDVAELGDRTSPDDWPEAMLVTADELTIIVDNAVGSCSRLAALRTPASASPADVEADDVCTAHCCCCGSYEPCCDCGLIMPSMCCVGEKCWCGAPASKKVGEEILPDDPEPHRHNLTSYVCAYHYAQLMGPMGAVQVGIAPFTKETKQNG